MGGLGNQMFQYAFGKRMALANNSELVLDSSLLLDRSKEHAVITHRDFDLDIFDLKDFRWATHDEIVAYNGEQNASVLKKIIRKFKNVLFPKRLVIQKGNTFNAEYLSIKPDACFVGRWQSELYFKDAAEEIKKDFSFHTISNPEILKFRELIHSCNAVCLHIRRGDLITSTLYSSTIGVLDWTYYEQALTYLRSKLENPVFFIFSDDSAWCKNTIHLQEPSYIMDDTTAGAKAEGHLYLMQQCKHFILSNSTYAWWGAYLSLYEKKEVVYPKNWYKDSNLKNPEMCPSEWVKF
jgi:hypothetical protein